MIIHHDELTDLSLVALLQNKLWTIMLMFSFSCLFFFFLKVLLVNLYLLIVES